MEPLRAEDRWIPADTFGSRLRQIRLELGLQRGLRKPLTVKETALMCGIHTATWSTWENGTDPMSMDQVVRQITKAIGVDPEWLMWGGGGFTLPPKSDLYVVQGETGVVALSFDDIDWCSGSPRGSHLSVV